MIANAGGTYVEIDTGADPHYNPTGMLRIHHRDVPPETLSDGVSAAAGYTLPSKPDRSLALGPAWRDRAGAWHALADHAGVDLDPAAFTSTAASAARVEFEIVYRGRLRGGATAVVEHVTVTPGRVEICPPRRGRRRGRPADLAVPAHRRRQGVLDLSRPDDGQSSRADTGALSFAVATPGATVERLDLSLPCRNGFMDACAAESPASAIASVRDHPGAP